MLTLVIRRALAQRRLVMAVLVLVALAATLMGVCALLLGPTQDRAFSREVQRTQPQAVEVDAFLANLSSDDLPAVRRLVIERLQAVLAALDPTVTATATSQMRDLDAGTEGSAQIGYLAAGNGIAPHARLLSGRWPASSAGTPEAALPATAAQRLHLRLGDQITLGQANASVGRLDPTTVVVVGTFRRRSPVGWENDLLGGAGFDPAYTDGSRTAAAYGPIVVDDAAFNASGSSVARLRVTAQPDLALADRGSVGAAVAALDGANGQLRSRVGTRAQIVLVKSELPATLAGIDAHQVAGRSTVLVAVLLGAALSLAAMLLAARLVASVRDEERVLLIALGISPRQQVVAAGLEALVLAAVAAVIAVPTAALLHSWLTHAAAPTAAGLAQSPSVDGGLVLAVLLSAVVLAPILVSTGLDTTSTSLATRRRWALARTGADLTLLALAVAVAGFSWRQLQTQPTTSAARGDVALTLAPAICLLATTLVVVRLSPVLLRVGSHLALRSRALVLPLSTQLASRRPHAVTAMALVAAAVATGTFGLGLRATWERSQADQAALRVGTDVRLRLPTAATAQQASDLVAVDDGGSGAGGVSAVIDRPLTIGNLGASGSPPMLIGIDSREAGSVLRGRLGPGTSWDAIGDRLSPGPPITGPALGDGATLQGRATGRLPISATATAVVEDVAGVRRPLRSTAVPLDGQPHDLRWPVPGGSPLRVVGFSLHLTGPPADDTEGAVVAKAVFVSSTLTLPSSQSQPQSQQVDWRVHVENDDTGTTPDLRVDPDADGGTRLQTTIETDTGRLTNGGSDLLARTFAAPAEVPVAISSALADTVGAKIGGRLSGALDGTPLPLRVVAVVPSVPSQPDRPAVLADADTVSRRLVAAGQLEPLVNELWIGSPRASATRALQQHRLGEVTTRAQVTDELRRGPLQVTVPTMLTVLVVATTALLLAAVALVAGTDRRGRAAELTRLRAIGLPRRGARRLLLLEHAAFFAPLVLLGVLVGALACAVLGPLMVRSELGAKPVPPPVASWPWSAELTLLAVVVLGSAAVTWVATLFHVRASDAAGLRMGDL